MDGDDHLWKRYYRQSHSPDQQIGELEEPISRHVLKRKPGTSNLKDACLKHTCARCGKLRSRTYRDDHPLAPGEKPIPGICSRPECARYAPKNSEKDTSKKKPQPQVIVLEFHHYLHCPSSNEPSSSIATAVELSGEEKTSRKELPGEYPYSPSCGWKFFPTLETQRAPQINLRSKPTLVYC